MGIYRKIQQTIGNIQKETYPNALVVCTITGWGENDVGEITSLSSITAPGINFSVNIQNKKNPQHF